MHEGATERIAGAKAVDDRHLHRRDNDAVGLRARERPARALLHDRELRPHGQDRLRRGVRITQAGGHLDLMGVPDRDRRMTERLARGVARREHRRPEVMAEVEVVDRAAARGSERRERRGAAGLLGKRGAGRPQDRHPCDDVEIELLRRDVQVRCLRCAIEEERKAIGREELAEHHRGLVRRIGADKSRVDAELPQRLPHVQPKAVVAHLRDHGAPMAEPRRRDGDIRGAAAERFRERLDLRERHADLLGIEIDADATDRDQLKVGSADPLGWIRHGRSRT